MEQARVSITSFDSSNLKPRISLSSSVWRDSPRSRGCIAGLQTFTNLPLDFRLTRVLRYDTWHEHSQRLPLLRSYTWSREVYLWDDSSYDVKQP